MGSRRCTLVLLSLHLAALCNAGPIGSLPNVTSFELGLKEGSCAMGDVVYMPGDEFPGSEPCERCSCAAAGVKCARVRCEPRPGCKALHRPDHCCPTYQCECEQEGRVYGNGEKLVDPADPCRVCYCQGGEVVCRRIACFVRDDCQPRLVPGRCCPEYDNCPLRGVTTVPGLSSSLSTIEDAETSIAPVVVKENVKPEITIKEITPVSEIPVITDVKIKEILPSNGIEVPEYPSSKSPLIPREVTSEKSRTDEYTTKTEQPVIIEVLSSSAPVFTSLATEKDTKPSEAYTEIINYSTPSKISLSTQDSISSEIYLSSAPGLTTIVSTVTPEIVPIVLTSKAPVFEEEDLSLLDHNPAFPPIPDDLSVLSNHGDEIVPEPSAETEHNAQDLVTVIASNPSTETVTVKEIVNTTPKYVPGETTDTAYREDKTTPELTTQKVETTFDTEPPSVKASPMLNLRSAIPTEILSVPSSVPEDITGEFDDVTDGVPDMTATSTVKQPTVTKISRPDLSVNAVTETQSTTTFVPITTNADLTTTDNSYVQTTEKITTANTATVTVQSTEIPDTQFKEKTVPSSTTTTSAGATEITYQTPQTNKATSTILEPATILIEVTSNPIEKSNIATEVTSQTELSSLPIETSDQNPRDSLESASKNKDVTSTQIPFTTQAFEGSSTGSEFTKATTSTNVENRSVENISNTEFVITPLGSSESATDTVELIKISPDGGQKSAIIENTRGKNINALTDLINLVGDVAAIGSHTEKSTVPPTTTLSHLPESEELIPVNAGYKSKNNNWNLNSITEIPIKSKVSVGNKQKVMEIGEEDETDNITDAAPPHDKVEPTTRRPIIDHVSDNNMPGNQTTSDTDDIEILTESYVPTLNKRPNKVVMKSKERTHSEESEVDDIARTTTAAVVTEATSPPSSSASPLTTTTMAKVIVASPVPEKRRDSSSTTNPLEK